MKLKDISDLNGHNPLSMQAVSHNHTQSPLPLQTLGSAGHSSPLVMDELVCAIRENLKLKAAKSPIVSVQLTSRTGGTGCTCGSGATFTNGGRASRRVSPYSVPSRENRRPDTIRFGCACGASTTASGTIRGSGHSSRGGGGARPGRSAGQEDPYELLQALLRRGTLIQEAVRRLREPQTKAGNKAAVLARTPSSVESCASCDSNPPTSSGPASFLTTAAACAAT